MIDPKETIAYCALGRIFGFHPIIARRIVTTLSGAASFFELSYKDRQNLLGAFTGFGDTDFPRELDLAAKELDWLHSIGKSFLALGDDCFPESLAQCPDCPMGLYYDALSRPEEIFTHAPFISIVGTRDLSPYGRDWCRRIVTHFSNCPTKPVIVSGFALGTDIEAHMTALECGLKTIAVLPTGIDAIYPARHYWAAKKLRDSAGCALVTDYPPGTAPQAINFLRRNRIIAGLSRATILIESKVKGGGLITAKFAFEYDRDLFALSGRIDDINSRGCNDLIASTKARLISSPEILANELGLGPGSIVKTLSTAQRIELTFGKGEIADNAFKVLDLIMRNRGVTPDEIAETQGWPFRKALETVMLLENKGFIETDLLQRCVANNFLSLPSQ